MLRSYRLEGKTFSFSEQFPGREAGGGGSREKSLKSRGFHLEERDPANFFKEGGQLILPISPLGGGGGLTKERFKGEKVTTEDVRHWKTRDVKVMDRHFPHIKGRGTACQGREKWEKAKTAKRARKKRVLAI